MHAHQIPHIVGGKSMLSWGGAGGWGWLFETGQGKKIFFLVWKYKTV